MQFYSQIGQDSYLYEKFFKDIKNGFYVDIGAHEILNAFTPTNTKRIK